MADLTDLVLGDDLACTKGGYGSEFEVSNEVRMSEEKCLTDLNRSWSRASPWGVRKLRKPYVPR